MVTPSEPYDCSLYGTGDDDLAGLDVLTCVKGGPQWSQLGLQLTWSAVVWTLVYSASKPMNGWWKRKLANEDNSPPPWVQKYIGTDFRGPADTRVEILLEYCQLFASSLNIWLWIKKSYTLQGSTGVEFALELLCVCLNCCHAWFGHIRAGFRPNLCFSLPVIIDSLTLSPIILQRAPDIFGGSWLTLAYLRAFQQLTAFKHLCNLGMFEKSLSDLTQASIIKGLECVLVVFTISGTMWILEGMGDIPGFADSFMASGMGGISFFQMIYLTFMTISTVGYGDYSPKTVLGRIAIVFATAGGVSYFTMASVQIMELKAIERSGKGRFKPSKKQRYTTSRGHIIVLGGGVSSGSVTVLETFLRALCREGAPEIVLLSETPVSDAVRALLFQEWTKGFSIQFFVGSPLNVTDMTDRVRAEEASMIFILCDFQTRDTDAEDRGNLLFASHVQRMYPGADFRLMLSGMPSVALATQIGLDALCAYSVESLKAAMMATSVRCPGFSTLVLNLGLPDLPDPDHCYGAPGWNEAAAPGARSKIDAVEGSKAADDLRTSPWLREYVEGCGLEPYGFLPATPLIGKTFTEAALLVATHNLLLLAAQVDGGMVINPGVECLPCVTENTVLFVLANDFESCNVVARNNDASVQAWLPTFLGMRDQGFRSSNQRRKSIKWHSPDAVAAVQSQNQFSLQGSSHGSLSVREAAERQPVGGGAGAAAFFGGSPASALTNYHAAASDATTELPPSPRLPRDAAPVAALPSSLYGGGQQRVSRASQGSIDLAASNAEKLAAIVGAGGHVVVLVMASSEEASSTLWHQLELIINIIHETSLGGPARAAATPAGSAAPVAVVGPPLVVVHSGFGGAHQRVMHVAKELGVRLAFCVGNLLDPLTLQAAGVPVAARVLTLAPSAPDSSLSAEREDERNLMLVMMLEQHAGAVWQRDDIASLCDWYSPRTVSLLPPPPPQPRPEGDGAAASPKYFEKGRSGSLHEFNAGDGALKNPLLLGGAAGSSGGAGGGGAFVEKVRKGALPDFKGMNPADIAFARREPRTHCRFAAGRVLPKPHLGALFSMAYYTPGVLELLESLINPAKYDQTSTSWMIDVPLRLVGSPYSDLAHEVMASGAVPMGLLRAASHACSRGGVRGAGLVGGQGNPLPYVVTALPKNGNLILRAGDSCYCVADNAWALRHGVADAPKHPTAAGSGDAGLAPYHTQKFFAAAAKGAPAARASPDDATGTGSWVEAAFGGSEPEGSAVELTSVHSPKVEANVGTL